MDEAKESAVFEHSTPEITVRLEITGYNELRDRPVFDGIASLTIAIVMGLREYGPDYALRAGPILIQCVRMIESVYQMFKTARGGGFKQ